MKTSGYALPNTRHPDFQADLAQTLQSIAAQLQRIGAPDERVRQMEVLAAQVFEPCVVAVVGRVSVGKSSFINALLGEDIAPVGATETTATVNHFVYREGIPDAARPIRCHWRGRPPEYLGRDLLHSLHGAEEEALRLAAAIEYLEYPVHNPYLKQVTLVDTPGLSSALDTHQNQTAGLFGLRAQMRAHNASETGRISAAADAVIFLIRQVALEDARIFLEELRQVMGGRTQTFHTVGILAQIDGLPDMLHARHALAAQIADQLKDSLNTVLPVSAGLQRALDLAMQNDGAGLRHLRQTLCRIPARRLKMLLSSDEFFAEEEFDDCPVSAAERKALLGETPWTVFTTLARAAADPTLSLEQVIADMTELAGFAPLKDLLERRFFQRGHLLRCHRIVNAACRLLAEIRYGGLEAIQQRHRAEEMRRAALLDFVRKAPGDPTLRRELEELVKTHTGPRIKPVEVPTTLQQMERELCAVQLLLEQENADIEALHRLEDHSERFTPEERAELRALFGFHGLEHADRLPSGRSADLAYVQARAQAWFACAQQESDPVRASAAQRATDRYGLILATLLAY